MSLDPLQFARNASALVLTLLATTPATWACNPAENWRPQSVGAEHPIKRSPSAILYGIVRTVTGVPVRGAEVVASPLSPDGKAARSISDSQGVYALGELVPGAVALAARIPGAPEVGPFSVRILPGQDPADPPEPQRFDIGGVGLDIPSVPAKVRAAHQLEARLVQFPEPTHALATDQDGILALGLSVIGRFNAEGVTEGQLSLGGRVKAVASIANPLGFVTVQGQDGQGEIAVRDGGGHLSWCKSVPMEPAAVAVGPAGEIWCVGSNLGGKQAVLLSRSGQVRKVFSLAHSAALNVAVDSLGQAWIPNGDGGLCRFDKHAALKGRTYLPTNCRRVIAAGARRLWAVGLTSAFLLDLEARLLLQISRPEPIELPQADSRGRLWFLENGKIEAVGKGYRQTFSIKHLPITGATSLALKGDHLWLLGLDRTRAAVAKLP